MSQLKATDMVVPRKGTLSAVALSKHETQGGVAMDGKPYVV